MACISFRFANCGVPSRCRRQDLFRAQSREITLIHCTHLNPICCFDAVEYPLSRTTESTGEWLAIRKLTIEIIPQTLTARKSTDDQREKHSCRLKHGCHTQRDPKWEVISVANFVGTRAFRVNKLQQASISRPQLLQ